MALFTLPWLTLTLLTLLASFPSCLFLPAPTKDRLKTHQAWMAWSARSGRPAGGGLDFAPRGPVPSW